LEVATTHLLCEVWISTTPTHPSRIARKRQRHVSSRHLSVSRPDISVRIIIRGSGKSATNAKDRFNCSPTTTIVRRPKPAKINRFPKNRKGRHRGALLHLL